MKILITTKNKPWKLSQIDWNFIIKFEFRLHFSRSQRGAVFMLSHTAEYDHTYLCKNLTFIAKTRFSLRTDKPYGTA